jgi:hypothetical protein
MDIIGIGYLGFETTKLDEWREYGPQVMGFGIGNTPESDPDSLYFKMDDRRHRLAFHPGTIDRIAYIGWRPAVAWPSMPRSRSFAPPAWISPWAIPSCARPAASRS